MNPIIEKVARALNDDYEAITPYNRLAKSKQEFLQYQAWTAIKATLEHLKTNAEPIAWMNEHGAVTRFGHEKWEQAGQKVSALYDLDAILAELDA
jgi:hypothetical protein